MYNPVSDAYRELSTGFANHSCVQVSGDGATVFCIAGSPTRFSTVISVAVADAKVTNGLLLTRIRGLINV